MDEKMIDATKVAEMLGRSVRWLYDSQAQVGIPRYRLGGDPGRGHFRYRRSEIEAWLEKQREGGL